MLFTLFGLKIVKSASTTAITRTTGRIRLPTRVIQCGWSLMTRFSPGRSLLMARHCRSWQLEKHEKGPKGQVGSVCDRPLHRAVRDDVDDRADRGEQNA